MGMATREEYEIQIWQRFYADASRNVTWNETTRQKHAETMTREHMKTEARENLVPWDVE